MYVLGLRSINSFFLIIRSIFTIGILISVLLESYGMNEAFNAFKRTKIDSRDGNFLIAWRCCKTNFTLLLDGRDFSGLLVEANE